MNISDIIKRRRSVRTFTGTMPPEDIMTELQLRVHSTACDHYRLVVVESAMSGNIGSYGVISKAPAWLALVTDGSDESALRCALEAEKIVLYLTSVNIGTCWVAGTFNQSKVQHAADTRENEHVVAVIPFGIAAPKRRLIESLQSGLTRSTSRKPFDKLFQLDSRAPEAYTTLLEAVRLAPSAMNVQPWRVNIDHEGKAVFSSVTDNKYTMLDMGIALAHFVLMADSSGVAGRLVIPHHPNPAKIAEWMPGDN